MTLMIMEYLPILVIETFTFHTAINTLKDVTLCKICVKYFVVCFILLLAYIFNFIIFLLIASSAIIFSNLTCPSVEHTFASAVVLEA